MTALIIDGKLLAQKLRAEWKLRADRLNALGIAPGLAVVMVGDNPASQVYVRNKIKACRDTGIRSEEHLLAGDSNMATVLALVDRLEMPARPDHTFARRRRPHDHRHAALQHRHFGRAPRQGTRRPARFLRGGSPRRSSAIFDCPARRVLRRL